MKAARTNPRPPCWLGFEMSGGIPSDRLSREPHHGFAPGQRRFFCWTRHILSSFRRDLPGWWVRWDGKFHFAGHQIFRRRERSMSSRCGVCGKTPPKVEIVKRSWYDKRRSLPQKLLSNIMRNGDVTVRGNLQVADFKRTFPSPHGRQDAQVKQASLQGEKNGEL